MGKKRSWFSLVNRLCICDCEAQPQPPKKEKESNKWRWVSVCRRLKLKQSPPAPALAAAQKTLNEAREEQRKHALAVAIATAAAAEAAVAAANAAAQNVRLTCFHQSSNDYEKGVAAAIKIQTAYRAHLARKAKKALKGLVKLQAIVRGQIVRRQVITKLKYLPSITNTPSQVHRMRVSNVDESCKDGQKKYFPSSKKSSEAKEIKLEFINRRSWDYSLSPSEDVKALWSRKQEGVIKKDRMKKYSVSHWERRNDQSPEEESKFNKETGRESHRPVEEWANGETYKRRSETDKYLTSTIHEKLRNAHKHDSVEEPNSPFSLPRRSFRHMKQKSVGNETCLPNSLFFPTYMAATESAKAKAKARSMSTPKQRLAFLDTFSDRCSPQKLKFSS